jgi:transposase
MKNETEVFVGIDVSKDWLDVNSGRAWRVANTFSGVKKLIKELSKLNPVLVVLESTGGYENLALEALWEAKIEVARVNPRRTKCYARALGKEAKSDAIDADMLRCFAMQTRPAPTPAPTAEVKKLKSLINRRTQLITMRTEEKNRVKNPISCPPIKRHIQKMIKFITAEIIQLEEQIDIIIKNSETLNEKAQVLQQETSVGPILTMTLLAELPELGTISRQQVAALVGVAPYTNQSGTFEGKRPIRGGRKHIRHILYMATVSAVRRNQKIKQFFLSMVRRGKPKMIALIAAMRRLIVTLNATLRDFYSNKNLRNADLLETHA